MTGNIVARRYARALFALGIKTGVPELESYASSLGALREVLAQSPDLSRAFRNPIFTAEELKKVIKKLAAKLKISGAILNFCLLLADKGRLRELGGIADAFDALLDQEKGVLRGELLTAVPLDNNKQQAVLKQLEKKAKRTLVLEFGVSPEILGGVVLKVGDQVMDASLRAQLSILKDTIKRGE
ncbi:F0F1 ATP synthase subunit delta [Desulfovibrio sp. OttesenSCG-928-A18]|nr:F0F1 ATP synthase subunit delta [Desulfovibrio sp. OttesenSCG-928-A18]